LEVADIFRDHGPAWRQANAGHASLGQLKVMSAIESCRTAALGGHVLRCEDCAQIDIAYNSCLMGKFRNGELAGGRVGLSADFTDFTLHYEQALDRTLCLPEVKKALCADAAEQRPQWLRLRAMRILGRQIYKQTF
jgi:hypothetical protein